MGKKRVFEDDEEEISESVQTEVAKVDQAPKKQKVLPEGYVCNACGAVGLHAIYNCPNKVSKKEKSKKQTIKEIEDDVLSSSQKGETAQSTIPSNIFPVFVSGLPFDATKQKVIDMIKEANNNEDDCKITTRDVIVMNFPDNPNKCNGLAYVNCHSEEDFNRALKLNGTVSGKKTISAVPSSQGLKQKSKDSGDKSRTADKPKRPKSNVKRCFRCGEEHDPKTCTNPRICYKCRGTDHISVDCPKKKGAKKVE